MATTDDPGFHCLLPTAELAERSRTWRDLAHHIVDRKRIQDGFRIRFHPSATQDLESVVTAERSCCGWATWVVDANASTVVLEVRGPPGPVAALAASFGL